MDKLLIPVNPEYLCMANAAFSLIGCFVPIPIIEKGLKSLNNKQEDNNETPTKNA